MTSSLPAQYLELFLKRKEGRRERGKKGRKFNLLKDQDWQSPLPLTARAQAYSTSGSCCSCLHFDQLLGPSGRMKNGFSGTIRVQNIPEGKKGSHSPDHTKLNGQGGPPLVSYTTFLKRAAPTTSPVCALRSIHRPELSQSVPCGKDSF